jgi:hypothetical protein
MRHAPKFCATVASPTSRRGARRRCPRRQRLLGKKNLRAARANRVFCTDEKRIRTENTVMDKSNNGLGLLLSEIADCERKGSSSARKR